MSSVLDNYRKVLKSRNDPRADYPDEKLALQYANSIKQTGQSFDDFAEAQGDFDFGKLVRAGYEEPKTLLGGATDAVAQQYYTKKQGYKTGTGVVLGSLGMDDLEGDLLRSSRRDARKSAKYGKEVFDDYEMIDDWEDFFQYVSQGASRSVVDIAPSMINAFIGKGIGSKIQKTLDKTDKFEGLKKKAKDILGDDYGGKIGMGSAAMGGSAVENTGHVYGELYEYTKLDPNDKMYLSPAEARVLSLAAGGVSGALDSALPLFLISKLKKTIGGNAAEEAVGKFFKSIPDGMTLLAQGAVGEGITEALQEVVQMMTVKYHTNEEWNNNDWNRMINGGLLGAIGGGTITGGTGALASVLRPSTETGDIEDVENLDSTEERIEITNRYRQDKFNNMEVGSIVMPAGSGKYARVVEKDEESNTVTIEYFSDNSREKINPVKLKVKEDSKKKIKKDDLANISDDKLTQLRVVRPDLESAIDAEVESRKEQVDDDTKNINATQLQVVEKKGKVEIKDLASREMVYRANLVEVDGVIEIQNETLDSQTAEREGESKQLLYDLARAKAKEKGILFKVGDKVEYPLTESELEAIDENSELYSLFMEMDSLINQYPSSSPEFNAISDAMTLLEGRMVDDGLFALNSKGETIKGDVDVKSNNSASFRNSKKISDIIAGKIFQEIENLNNDFTSSYGQTDINEKLILANARDLALEYADGVNGFNDKTDVTSLAKAATEIYAKHYLKDNAWKVETDFDKESKKLEEEEIEKQRLNNALDSFIDNKPAVGRYVKLEKGGRLVRITEINDQDFTIKTELDPSTSILADKILKVYDSRQIEVMGESVTEGKDSITKSIYVTGSATGGTHKGTASVTINIDEKGNVLSFNGKDKTIKVDPEMGLNLQSDELKGFIATQVLDEVKADNPPKKKPLNLGGGIYKNPNDNSYSGRAMKIGKSKRLTKDSKGVYEVTPNIDEDGRVSSINVAGQTEPIELSKAYEAKEWITAAREAMKVKKLWGEVLKPKSDQELEAEAEPTNKLEFTAKGRANRIIIPTAEITPIDDLDKEGDGNYEAIKLINSLEPGNSTVTNKAVVFRYYRKEGDEPIYLVRTVAMAPELKKITVTDKDGTKREVKEAATVRSVVGMKKKQSDYISPLTQKNGAMNFNDSKSLEALYGDLEDGPRLEIAEILTFRENARVVSDFSNESEYRKAIGGILDYDKIRTAESIVTLHEEVKDLEDDQSKRIYGLLNDGTRLNPVLDIFDPNISAGLIKEFKQAIADRALLISQHKKSDDPATSRIVELGKKISIQKDTLRMIDIEEFMTHIKVGKQSGFSSLSEDGKYNTIEKALSKFADGSKVKKSKEDSSSITTELEVDPELTPDTEEDFRDEMDKYEPPSADDFIKVGQYYYPRQRGDRELADTSEFPVYKMEINEETHYVTSEEDSGGNKVWFRYGDVDRAQEGKTGPFNIISDYEFQAESKKELRKLLKEQSEESAPEVEEESPKETDTSASGTPLPKSSPPKRNPNSKFTPEKKPKQSESEREAKERSEVVESMERSVLDADLDPEPRGIALGLIKEFKRGKLDIGNAYRLVQETIENAQSAMQNESVGEVAHSEESLEREIKRHINEPKSPRLNNLPLEESLTEENSKAVQDALGGAEIDGKPIRLGAYLDRIVMLERGTSTVDGAILDMAQVLMNHPFTKNLKIQFRSWENFKDGVENDGSNGKITRAYVKGDTIVMGPYFKLKASDDISASESLQVTLLEEVAHRVLGTAIESAIQAKIRGKLPRGASKVINYNQAVKFYDETKELMDWLKGQTDGEYYHGLLNMHEFWANFASNPRFRKFLNKPMPPAMRRKFSSRFEKVIDWILDLVGRIFDVDLTPNRTASDVVKKRYRTLLRTSDKLAANDVDLMSQSQNKLYYRGDSANRSDSNGLIVFTENEFDAQGYAAQGMADEDATDVELEELADKAESNTHAYDLNIKNTLDLTQGVEGWKVLQSLNDKGDRNVGRILNKGDKLDQESLGGIRYTWWSYTTSAYQPTWKNIIVPQLIEKGYDSIKYSDDNHDTIGIFNVENATEISPELQQMESADSTDDSASIARGTLRAHMGAMKDFGSVVESVVTELGDDFDMTDEQLKEFMTIDGRTTPDVVSKILDKKEKVLIEEAQQSLSGAVSPAMQNELEGVNSISELETVANRDTGARNLMKLLTGAKQSVMQKFTESSSVRDKALSRLVRLEQRMSELTSEKTMFDASKTQAIFAKHLQDIIYKNTSKGERSIISTLEHALGETDYTPFSLLREMGQIDASKLYDELSKLATGFGKEGGDKAIKIIEELTTEEIFNVIDVRASDIGIMNPKLDRAVQMGIAYMLSSDGKNDVPRSAFTTRLRLAKNELAGTSVTDALNLIKAAAAGRPTKDIKDKSMRTIINAVRSIKKEMDELRIQAKDATYDLKVANEFLKGYNDRIADLDEYFQSSAPVELVEGGEYDTLTLGEDGKIRRSSFRFSMGKGESSDEAKYSAATASELFKIMDTQEYKDKYSGTPEGRYFKQLATELRKPNFGIQYEVSNVGFLHAAASALQERFSRLGPAGKLIATALNEYTRDYQSESGQIFSQGRKVSGALRRLHTEMGLKNGENMNQFMTDFGRKLFDWFNERPDLHGQEELAINKVWNELKESDIGREYTDEGKKALRVYLKQWSIQSENFKRLYRKHNISVLDEDVSREAIATGGKDKLYRNFVEQGVYTTPRKLNMAKISALSMYLDPKFGDEDYLGAGQEAGSFFGKLTTSMIDAKARGVDFNESFTQTMGKLVDSGFSNLFFRPYFTGKSVHSTPFTITSTKDDKKNVRVIMPEELERIWRNAEGNSPGIRVANAILDMAKILPDFDESTVSNILQQFDHRAKAILLAEKEARTDRTAISNQGDLSTFMSGKELHTSIHARSLYNILPGELFEYEMYDETSSGQHLSKLIMTAKFGRNGEKLKENFLAIRKTFEPAHNLYKNLSDELGIPLKNSRSMPSRTNKYAYSGRVKRMKALMAEKGLDPSTFEKLDTDARSYVEAEKAYAAAAVAFTSRSSDIQDITLGLEILRTLAFGMVNTMKGAWTATMSIFDIVKVLGLNPTAFKTLGGTYKNLAREVAGSFLEGFGVEMIRADKHASDLSDSFGREAGMATFSENITEIGKQGALDTGLQGTLRKTRNIVNALSTIGGSKRRKTSGNFVPGSVLTALTAPFTYLAQATNKSISLAMANTIESFVLKTVEAHEARNLSLTDNMFEVKAEDLGYEDSKLDAYIFGNMDMIKKLNLRLTAEGMSFSQLAQDYRRRRESDPDTRVLTKDAVLASHNIAMSEVTYDTMSGKGSWTLGGSGQFLSPLVGWSFSSYSKGVDQMRNKEGRMAMRESIRYMLTSTAWLLPAGIAFTLFTDWWDEEVLGKPSSLGKVPLTAALPFVGLPLAMTDPRFKFASMVERSMRANNILGIAQEFASPIIVGQLDPSSMASRFDPTRRILGISTVMNLYSIAMNYSNAIRTGGAKEIIPDYSTVVRPLLYATGLNAVVQNAQAISNLTGLEEIDPTGFLSSERQSADITGMRNSLRTHAKVMGMEMRKGGIFQFTTTAISNAIRGMERTAYANDKEGFKKFYRRAIQLSQAEDARKDVAEKFKKRHLRTSITRFSLSDPDLSAIMSVFSDGERSKIRKAMMNHDFYLRSIGGTPKESRSDTRQYNERLRRLAL